MKRVLLLFGLLLILGGCEPPIEDNDTLECEEGYILVGTDCVLDEEDIVYPEPTVTITSIKASVVRFEIVIPENDYNLTITGLRLMQGTTSIVIDDLSTRLMNDLEPETVYQLEYTYTHDTTGVLSVMEYTKSISFTTEAAPLVVPTVSIESIGDIVDSVYVRIDLIDFNDDTDVDSITLMQGDTVVGEYDFRQYLYISNLDELTNYELVVEYSYFQGQTYLVETESIRFTTSSPVIEYFCDIALGFEFGDNSEITRKWITPMKIYIDGTPSDELLAELDRIILELNGLFTDGFYIEIVEYKAMSNFQVVFSNTTYYETEYYVDPAYTANNWGLFTVWWDSQDNLNRGHMYVDIDRNTNLQGQKHVLREELTQALGLAKDSYEYNNSIFQQAWTTYSEYAEIDRDLIWMLYHPMMTSGLDDTSARRVLEKLVKDGLPNHEE